MLLLGWDMLIKEFCRDLARGDMAPKKLKIWVGIVNDFRESSDSYMIKHLYLYPKYV